MYDIVIGFVYDSNVYSYVYFIDVPGETSKKFLYNRLLATVRSHCDIALAMASSGITALLLQGGRTVHSRLKVTKG